MIDAALGRGDAVVVESDQATCIGRAYWNPVGIVHGLEDLVVGGAGAVHLWIAPAVEEIAPLASVAASVMNPAPVTPLAPFDVSIATSNRLICCFRSSGVFVACARNTAAIAM